MAGEHAQTFDDKFSHVTVFQRGPQGRIVAHNRIHRALIPSFVYDEDRLYVRSQFYLHCIGYTGDEGKAYEAEVNARNILGDLAPRKPSATTPKPLKPASAGPGRGRPFRPGCAVDLGDAVFLGPLPIAAKDEALRKLGGPSANLSADKSVSAGGETAKAYAFSKEHRSLLSGNVNHMPALAMSKILGKKRDTVSFVQTRFPVAEPRTLRLLCRTPGTDVWISGTATKNMDRVSLAPGVYRMLIRISVPGEASGKHDLAVQLVDSSDAKAEQAFWIDSVKRSRKILERVIALKPGSPTAARAKAVLAEL
jgi:hypothetical protein